MTSPIDHAAHPNLDPVDRAARFLEGPPKFPRRPIWIGIAILAVVGIGGAFADKSFNVPSQAPKVPVAKHAKSVSRTLAEFVGLRTLGHTKAPALDLIDQNNAQFSLSALVHRVVVLSFLDPSCKYICPIESAEFHDTVSDLGARAAMTAFVAVDANPTDLGVGAASAAMSTDRLATLPDPYFLSGPLSTLSRIWSAYGVTVEYEPSNGRLAYTNVIYVIGPTGTLEYALEPFGNESSSGTFSLTQSEIRRFGRGIARYVEKAGA